MNPYIGITDFTNLEQVLKMSSVFAAHLPQGSNRKLHIGVMMSHKTLHNIPNRWQNVFPQKETISNIFSSNEVYNCLHYVDYAGNPDLQKNIAEAISLGGIGIHALQLDMTWPDPNQIARGVHSWRKYIEVILQIGKNSFEEVNNDPQSVVEKLRQYEGVVHRVLLDKSMGRGIVMDAKSLMPFAQTIRENFPELGIVVAGGLGPETIQLVEPLVKEFSDLSIDAQGRLRPSGNALDPIDWDMAEIYLIKALQLFS